MRHASITGTGSAVPERIVTNAELSALLGEDINAFVEGTLGITTRHWCGPDEATSDLAVRAAERALESAGLTALDLDLVIVATDTPDYIAPSTASVVQGRLGAKRAGTFDLNAGCAGFVTALDTAWKFIRADERYSRVLVVGAYAMSKYLDHKDKKTLTIFADGAGAAIVERDDRPGLLASELFADGSYCEDMGIFAGGTRTPIDAAVLADGFKNHLRFVRKYPASVNEEGWPRIVRSVLGRAGSDVASVRHWFWTQVNRSTIEVVMGILGEPMSKAHTIMHKWGYTGSACLPMALDDARRAGKLAEGDLIVFTGSGAGLAMGTVAMRWRDRAK